MRFLLLLLFLPPVAPVHAQLNNWDPSWRQKDSALVFNDDLDFYLNAYSKAEVKTMRKQVNTWRMNFDKLMRATINDLRTHSEGGGMVPGTHDFTLPAVDGGTYSLRANDGKVRAFMFVR